jgi:polyhydroxybutyrate depolymerase
VKNIRGCLFGLTIITFTLAISSCGTTQPGPTSLPTPLPTLTRLTVTLSAGDSQRNLTINGLDRSYLLHIPPGLAVGQPVPMVFVFHGLGEADNLIQQASGMNAISDLNGFIVVYPNGSGPGGALSWNAGNCCGYAHQNNVDDTAFVRQIIEDVSTISPIDPKRIYATGFSNGALFSYRLACDLSDTFAAIAPVAGVMLYNQCQPQQPVSVIDFHGLSDNVVPYSGGGVIPDVGRPFPPVEDSLKIWAKFNGCSYAPTTESSNIYTLTTYDSCRDNVSVELYAVKGIGHSWPSEYVIPASQLIWDFFKTHPKQ